MAHPRRSMVFETRSEDETIDLGARLARLLCAGDVIALEGELGAGKTRFVRGLARGIGADERLVSSPTYVLAHEYRAREGAPGLLHVDAYRIRSGEELDDLGLDRALARGDVLVVEWASRLGDRLAPDRLLVTIEHAGDDRRIVTFAWIDDGEAWAARLASL